ncbi:MAG: hypothetical protein AAGU03_05495 [Anaerolineaceae bacterium]
MEKKKTSLAQMLQDGDKKGFLAFREKFAEMSKEHPLREPNKPKNNKETQEQKSQEVFSITYRIPNDETISVEEHIQFVLTEFNPEALALPERERYAAYQEVMTWFHQQVSPDFDSNDLSLDDTDIKPHESPNENTDAPAVQRAKKTRLMQLSLLSAQAPAANAAIRSRLFTTGTGPRAVYQRFTPIASWHKDLLVEYQGEELRQEECSVWIQLCKLAASNPQFQVQCTIYGLLKSLKRKDTGGNRKVLKEQLLRIFHGKLHIKLDKAEYYGSILPEFSINSKGNIIANLSKTIAKLLGMYDFTMVNMDVRLGLGNMAQWFHVFLKSQAGPEVTIPWEKVHELSGSSEKSMENFMRNFRRLAIKPLMQIGFIQSARTRQGRLVVQIDKEKG